MGKRVNFCKDCKFCYHHKLEFSSYYCTNPKVTSYNFIDGREEYVLCGAVRRRIDNMEEYWKEYREVICGDDNIDNVAECVKELKERHSNKSFQYCPLYRKKLTLGRFLKLKFLKLIRYGKKLL